MFQSSCFNELMAGNFASKHRVSPLGSIHTSDNAEGLACTTLVVEQEANPNLIHIHPVPEPRQENTIGQGCASYIIIIILCV